MFFFVILFLMVAGVAIFSVIFSGSPRPQPSKRHSVMTTAELEKYIQDNNITTRK